MSFAHTMAQMRARQKDVTRRLGWLDLEPGEELLAIEKGQGLRKGEKVKPIHVIRVRNVRRERLDEIVNQARGTYGQTEMVREGFPGMDPQFFMLQFFVERIDPSELITRIEFEHL